MSIKPKIKPLTLAILAGLSIATTYAAEDVLPKVNVNANAEAADGPVDGYRATRSATFTKTDTPLKEVPASVTVVPAELMEDQAMHNLAEVIRYVPGAAAHQGEGNRDDFVFRGLETSANLYADGIRDDAQVFRDPYNLERVEVLKGAGGMIFGRGAGGVLNRVTRKPVFGHTGSIDLTYGQNNQVRTSIDLGEKINESAAWRLNAVGEGSDSFRIGDDMRRRAINPTLTLLSGEQTALTLGYENLNDERTADRGVPSQNGLPVDIDPGIFYGNADQSHARSRVNGAYAILEHDFGDGLKLKNNFRVTHYNKFYQNVYTDNANASSVTTTGIMKLAAYNNANQRTNYFNQTDLTFKFNTGSFEQNLLAGLELGRQDSSNHRNSGFFGAAASNNLISVPVSNPYAVVTRFQPSANDADNNTKADIAGLYLQDQIELTKEWKLLAGLRYDSFKADFDDRRTVRAPNAQVANQTIPPTDLSRTDTEFSSRVGLIWVPTAAVTYYLSYSTSFLPSADTLGLSVLNVATGVTTADLAPQDAVNYEFGMRWDVLPNLTASAALFRMDLDHVRNSDGAGGFVLVGQQRTEGLELSLQGNITSSWQVFAGYAHLDSEISKATAAAGTLGHVPQLVPKSSASIWNKVTLSGGWSAGLGVIYQGEAFTNIDNVVRLPDFTRVDAAVYYAFPNGKTRLALNLENLSDTTYFPTSDGNNNISPGAPRNARLSLNMQF